MKPFKPTVFFACIVAILLAGACTAPPTARPPNEPTADIPPTLAPITPEPPTEQAPTASPEPTVPPGKGIWVDPLLPSDIYVPLRQQLDAVAQTTTGDDQLRLSVDAANSAVKVSVAGTAADVAVITRTLAVAAAFPTVADGLQLTDLQRFWAGDPSALAGITNDNTAPTLFLDADTRAALVLLLGSPAESPNIVLLQPQEVLSKTWESRNAAFAILPFEKLDVRYKLLWVNGINLFEREADMSQYPLALRVRLSGDPAVVERLRAAIKPADNRELSKLAVVAMTGVTALVRGTAVRMEEKGVTYPGEKIRDWLATADIAHISNEVSFWDKCRPPSRNDGVVMCSNPKYMELLRYVGTDIVELTGNHTWDYGADKLVPTIELYEKEGWKVFGGGRNLEESRKPTLMTVNGNKIAFIGCSYFGTNWATDVYPGATPCGVSDPQSFDWIIPAIKQLKADGYLVVATLQYTEFYNYVATKQQDIDFRALRDAGAVVVNGSQGHHVQGFDVNENGFCHYGTGNLFFGDQTFSKGAQQTMVDRHVFYDGRYVGVDLRTAFIEDISQPVPLGSEARAELLKTLFEASGYK